MAKAQPTVTYTSILDSGRKIIMRLSSDDKPGVTKSAPDFAVEGKKIGETFNGVEVTADYAKLSADLAQALKQPNCKNTVKIRDFDGKPTEASIVSVGPERKDYADKTAEVTAIMGAGPSGTPQMPKPSACFSP